MRKLFGTDGIRGRANSGNVTPEVAFRLGRAGAMFFKSRHAKPRIVIGRDTRLSGDMLEGALVAGISSVGVNVLKVGVLPTPAIAYLTKYFEADAGIVISASHNLFEDNGIKFFSPKGEKLSDAAEAKIEDLFFGKKIDKIHADGRGVGQVLVEPHAQEAYCQFALRAVPENMSLRNLHIVVDCGHGATYLTTPEVLRRMGARVTVMHDLPDGVNINDGCGSTDPSAMCEAVVRLGADVGLAHDGDGDRVIIGDESGNVIDGDRILGICALHMKEKGELKKNTVVATVMSNLGFEQAMKKNGIKVLRTQVGDRYVLETLKKKGAVLGGEQSGHVIYYDHAATGDGLVTALNTLRVMKESGRLLTELADFMTDVPQVLLNVKVKTKKDISKLKAIKATIKTAEETLGDKGRVLVRYSGTEAKIRIMIEGESQSEIELLAGQIKKAALKELGAG